MSPDTVVLTDSTSGLPRAVVDSVGLIVVPCQIHIGDEVFREGVDLTAEELFVRIFASEEVPTTSLPAGEDYDAAFQEALDRGADRILGIFMGSAFSGTFNGARLRAKDYPVEVELIDSGTTSLALGFLVLEAVRRLEQGEAFHAVASSIRQDVDRAELYALLDTLEYVRRGGRIGRLGEVIANVLNIKPILRVTGNAADAVARVRSHKKGISWLLNRANEAAPLRHIGVIHVNAEQEARELAMQLQPLLNSDDEILITPAPAAVATHGGPGAIGFGLLR